MAKRSNFQGGIPGSYANMMKQAQRMQAQIQQSKEQLEQQSLCAAAGGGADKATVTGARKVTSIEIAKEAVDPDDVETLQELVMAAVNEALGQVDAAEEQLFGGMI